MKGNTNNIQVIQNIDTRLLQKGPLDFKVYWNYVEDRYFNQAESSNSGLLLSKIFELEEKDYQARDSKDEAFKSGSYLDEALLTKDLTTRSIINKLFGISIYSKINFKSNLDKQSPVNEDESKSLIKSSLPLQKINNKEISQEIVKIESIIKNTHLELMIQQLNNRLVSDHKFLNPPHIHLQNIRNQIRDLSLAQFAESIIYVYKNNATKTFQLELDNSYDLPNIELSEVAYKKLISFRDSSNFILSYDKALKSHINPGSNDKKIDCKKDQDSEASSFGVKVKKVTQKIEIAKDINVECYICHNCKIRKPIELMTKCRNKYVDRQFKIFQIFNMLLLQKNEKYYIYFDYKGEIKDLQQQLSSKILQEKQCNKYFCNFCLRGSYQTDPESVKNKKDEKTNSDQASNNKNSSSTKLIPVTKDWCCPWCMNDCFCSRCIRTEHIFKLIGLHAKYDGYISDLKEFMKQQSSVLEILEEYTIPFNTIIKDGQILIRINRSANGKYCKDKRLIEVSKENSKENEILKLLNQFNYKAKQLAQIQSNCLENIKESYFMQDLNENESLKENLEIIPKVEVVKRKKGRPRKYEKIENSEIKLPSYLKKKRVIEKEEESTKESDENEVTKQSDGRDEKKIKKEESKKALDIKTPDQKLPELFIFPLGPNSVFKRRIKSIRKRIRLQIKQKTNKRKYNKKSNQSEVILSKKKPFISSREMRFKKRSSK